MPIETVCPGCQRTLKVDDSFAGQQARCPVCSAIYTVPGESTDSDDAGDGDAAATWHLRTPDGRLYGPVTAETLESWVREGRVTQDSSLMDEQDGQWQPASTRYPVLETALPSTEQLSKTGKRYRYTEPHRGGLVLSLGIVSWLVFCPLFGVLAWMMGSADLRDMQSGRMDPSGRGATQAGHILGMIQSLISLAGLVVSLFVLLARVAGF